MTQPLDMQVAVQLHGPVRDVPRPDGVIVLATERDAIKHDSPARNGLAGGGHVDMGMRPSQQSMQSRGGQVSQGNGRSNGGDLEMGMRQSQQSTHSHAGPHAMGEIVAVVVLWVLP